MFLVTGGYGGSDYRDSTEIYDPDHGSWRYGAALPSPRKFLRVAYIDSRILIFGIDIYCEVKPIIVIGYNFY